MSQPRPPRPTTALEVKGSEWLTPHMVRIIAGGDGFEDFGSNGFADAYVKILFAADGSAFTEPVDVAAMRESLPSDQWPKTRTYSIRSIDEGARELAIDFVIHGDEGIAAPWAANAKPGDLLQFVGPGGAWSPPEADFHLFVGDESALPAIAAGLERLPADARGAAIIEVHEHPLDVAHPEGVELHWVVRGSNEYDPGVLATRVRALQLREEGLSVFAHGERESMKQLRPIFKELGLPRERLSISGYWAYGRIEDAFQAEKRTEVGKV